MEYVPIDEFKKLQEELEMIKQLLSEKIIPKKDIELWLSSFEKFFRKLTDEEKKTLDNKLFVKFLSHETLLTDDNIIALFNTLDFKKIKAQYPL